MAQRLLIVSILLVLATGYVAYASRAEEVPVREPLARVPLTISEWKGRDLARFAENIERELGADEYVNRLYSRGPEPAVSLYLGYYRSQRQGDTIHSPMNCLPGAGWQPVTADRGRITVGSPARTIEVNRYVIEKGIERQVVLYWYQSHGRVIASEYWSKIFMVYDAVRLNRTDAALVRVISPILPAERGPEPATLRVTEFVREFFPLLDQFIPS